MKLVIADDHTLFRDTLLEFIRRKFSDCAIKCSDDFDGVMQILSEDPEQDLVLLDLRMPGMQAMSGFKKMKECYPNIKVALMSGMAEPNDVRAALQEGAVGYFPKTIGGRGFVEGVEKIIAGGTFVPVDVLTDQVMTSYRDDSNAVSHAADTALAHASMQDEQAAYVTESDIGLTPREYDVISFLSKGLSNKEIAFKLDVKEVTVKLHVRGICQKLGVTNRTQAALKARELNIGE